MNDNPPDTPSTLQLFEPVAEDVYSIEAVAHISAIGDRGGGARDARGHGVETGSRMF